MIDLSLLRQEIRRMTPRNKLFKALKEELKAQNRWKDLPRGNPSKGYEAQLKSKGAE